MNNHGLKATNAPGLGYLGGNGMQLLFSAMERERQQQSRFPNPTGNTQVQEASLSLIDRTEPTALEKGEQEKLTSKMNGVTPHLPRNILVPPNFPHALHAQSGLDYNGMASTSHTGMDLRCLACGIACQSVEELHKHIIYKHLGMENLPNTINPALLPTTKDSAFPGALSNLDKNNQNLHKPPSQKGSLEFPIPTPNFGLINTSYNGTQQLGSALKSSAMPSGLYAHPPTSFPTFPSLTVPPQLKSFPVQPFANPYGVSGLMNPFLGMNYPGLPINGIYPSSSIPGLLATNMNMYSPYLPFPTHAGQPFLPARIPFLPNEINTDRSATEGALKSNFPVVPSPKQNNDVSDALASSKTGSSDQYFSTTEPNAHNSGLRSAIPDAYHRRMSTPILSMNKNFRFPFPYNRMGKISDVGEQMESLSVPSKIPPKSNTRDPNNRLNAKSIEQHISKLISNNEKVLLNPVLERVKPRRVFRRNSLDPASLSSYAASISGRNNSEMQFGEDRIHKIERKYSEVNHRRGSLVPEMLRSADLHHFPPGMTSSEYKKMIQLTRAPHGRASLVEEVAQIKDVMGKLTDENQNFISNEHNHLLGKRESLTQYQAIPPKKLRKTNFFECSDCGVRYRKEENYVIHKQVYCKFKKIDDNFNLKNLPILNQPALNDTVTSRYSVIQKAAEFETNLPPTSHAVSLQNNSQKIQTFLQSDIGTNPMAFLHNDLCRTKSADAALQTEHHHRLSKDNKPQSSVKSAELDNVLVPPNCSSIPAVTNATNSPNESPPCSCIPTSKLPPNKRHMQLLRCSGDGHCKQNHTVFTMATSPTKSTSGRKVSAPLPRTQTFCSEELKSDRKLSLQNTWKPDENTLNENVSFLGESSVPRSNYKLLLHQISLRNMQDMDLIKQSAQSPLTQSENSIWSWEQMCKIGKMPPALEDTQTLSVQNTETSSLQNADVLKNISGLSGDLVRRNTTANLNQNSTGFAYAKPSDNLLATNKPYSPDGNGQMGEKQARNCVIVSPTSQELQDSSIDQLNSTTIQLEQSKIDQPANSLKQESDSKENADIIANEKCADGLLYLHLSPVLYANAHVSYCCLANPQPTFTKLGSDANQLSMYSQWAVAEPLLVPEQMTVIDLLNSWRKSKSGYTQGISVSCKDTNKLLVTDSKTYKKLTKNDKENKTSETIEMEKIQDKSEKLPETEMDLFLSRQYKYSILKANSKFVYTSCAKKYCKIETEILPQNSASNNKTNCKNTIVEKKDSVSDEIPLKCDVKISLPTTTKSSSPNSDSGHLEIRKLGRIKRRKTRKERSAASPREKRRALYSQSPPSPLCQIAVHQSESCKGITDDRLKGCALCSIKAGRSDLIPEVTSACKPCQDAAKSKEKNSKLETLSLPNIKSPAKFSPQYHSPVPEHTNGYLDKTRASGNTQHWMTKSVQNDTPSNPSAFHYPVPERHEKDPKISASSPPNTPATVSDGHHMSDPVRSPCTPQLAEAVSEVMRSAAIQSKRQGISHAHAHPLAHSRPLIPVTSSNSKAANESNVKMSNSVHKPNTTNSNHVHVASSLSKRNEVNVTSSIDAPISAENEIAFSSADHDNLIPNGFGKLGRRNLVLSTRESELFLHKANHLTSPASYRKEPRSNSQSTKTSVTEMITDSMEKESACQEEFLSCDSDIDSGKEEYDDIKKADVTARPYICVECKVAFRIGGHLAKHLRSKGHTLMMQKKTLNRLKQQQHKVSGTGNPPETTNVATQDGDSVSNAQISSTNNTSSVNSTTTQVLSGTEGLARSQVRALFEGNDEYACVPHCDDVIEGTDDVLSAQDPRPFKCLACDVAFRFQGHLDRHFRSNLHLIAVGHYEHDVNHTSHQTYNVNSVDEQGNDEELIVDGEPSPTSTISSLNFKFTKNSEHFSNYDDVPKTSNTDTSIFKHTSSNSIMTSHTTDATSSSNVINSTMVTSEHFTKSESDLKSNNYLGNYCLNDSQIHQKSNDLNPSDGAMGRHNHQVAMPCQIQVLSSFQT